MTDPQPQHITLENLMELLRQEVCNLTVDDQVWWEAFSVTPFTVQHGSTKHFAVAVSGANIIFFADDEDELGLAKLAGSSQSITDYGLAGDLKDAVGIIRANQSFQ